MVHVTCKCKGPIVKEKNRIMVSLLCVAAAIINQMASNDGEK